jgi:flagella basal body P-ring formation protein FlgA
MSERKRTMKAKWMMQRVSGMVTVKRLFLALALITLNASLITASTQQIDSILRDYIKKNYPWAEIELSEVAVSENLPDAAPEKILVLRGMPGKTLFSLEYRNGTKITASANIRAFDWVVMTRRAFRKGYAFQKEDLYMTLMDTSRIPKDAIKSIDKVEGTTLTRSVPANMPVAADMTGESAMIKRGTKVTIVAEAEGFSISARGELKENGYVGNDVKVLNVDSKRIITGRLSSENTVKVVF